MTDPIKTALDEAAKRLCFGHDGEGCDMCIAAEQCERRHDWPGQRKDAAAAIAAFLRALPDDYLLADFYSRPSVFEDMRYFASTVEDAER